MSTNIGARAVIRDSYIETSQGLAFYPLAPKAGDIRIEDIARALSNQCRFSGHTKHFYSVAEHSVRVSKLLEDWGLTLRARLFGLLHDASEAYLVDVPTPLKKLPAFDAYREAEGELQAMIYAAFGCVGDVPESLKHADATLLATEVRDLMPGKPEHWQTLDHGPVQRRITPWSARTAEAEFLQRFEDLYTGVDK